MLNLVLSGLHRFKASVCWFKPVKAGMAETLPWHWTDHSNPTIVCFSHSTDMLY